MVPNVPKKVVSESGEIFRSVDMNLVDKHICLCLYSHFDKILQHLEFTSSTIAQKLS